MLQCQSGPWFGWYRVKLATLCVAHPPQCPKHPGIFALSVLVQALLTFSPMISISQASNTRSPFEDECLRYRSELLAAAMRMTHHADDAQDLVQETFLRALAAWPRFIAGSNSRAWLYRIMTNLYINLYRKRRRYTQVSWERPVAVRAAIEAKGSAMHTKTPEDALLGDALGDEVVRALGSLSADYRTVVEMADLSDVRYRDIAVMLDVPMGTVMSRLFRARKKLAQELRDFAATDYGIHQAA